MPFVQQTPRAFTRQNIEALKPNQYGVHGLFKQSTWIYVGKGDVRQRLLEHLDGDNPSIVRQQPTHWVDEIVAGDASAREKQLIAELAPVCNQRVG